MTSLNPMLFTTFQSLGDPLKYVLVTTLGGRRDGQGHRHV